MRRNNRKTAFSLIELSIVVLIIGILIGSVVQGSKLYYKFKVQTARQLTQSSSVNGIKDLVLWYETSLDSSFDANQNFDANTISTWHDINPQRSFKKDATQSKSNNCAACPKFVDNVKGLPALKFSGAQSFNFNGDDLVNSDYTIFVIEQRTTDTLGVQTFVGSGLNGISLGWYSGANPNIYQIHDQVAINLTCCGDSTSPNIKTGVTRMHTFYFSKDDGAHYWLFTDAMSSSQNTAHSPNSKTPISSWDTPLIGANLYSYYAGNIAEIIMFNRALTLEEIMAIEKYLGQKYSIITSVIKKS